MQLCEVSLSLCLSPPHRIILPSKFSSPVLKSLSFLQTDPFNQNTLTYSQKPWRQPYYLASFSRTWNMCSKNERERRANFRAVVYRKSVPLSMAFLQRQIQKQWSGTATSLRSLERFIASPLWGSLGRGERATAHNGQVAKLSVICKHFSLLTIYNLNERTTKHATVN